MSRIYPQEQQQQIIIHQISGAHHEDQPATRQQMTRTHRQQAQGEVIMRQPTKTSVVMTKMFGVTQPDMSKRPWGSGICACFDDIITCCIVGGLSLIGCMECYGWYLSTKMDESCLLCLLPCYLSSLRTKLRAENDIEGSICNDCCMTVFCRPCAMCQITRELESL